MTPRADGSSDVAGDRVPSLRGAGQASKKSVRGASTSAPDRPIFSKDEAYVDRAAERRAATKRDATPTVDVSRGSLSLAETNVCTDKVPKREPTVEGECTSVSVQKGLVYKSKMAENLCKSMGWDPTGMSVERRAVQAFLPGKMAYEFELIKGNVDCLWDAPFTPKTVLRSQLQTKPTTLPFDPPEILDIVTKACAPPSPPAAPGSHLTNSMDGPVEEDIFPDVGDYVFEERKTTSPANAQVSQQRPLFTAASTDVGSASSLPASLESLVRELNAPSVARSEALREESSADGYEECYPGVYESAMDMFDDDDDDNAKGSDVADNSKLTKRQLAARERQKLDRTLSKVTKIMEAERRKKESG